jgi:hypothetical protein
MPSYLCFGISIRCIKFGHSPQTGGAVERAGIGAFCDQGLQGGETEGKRECRGHKQPGDAFFEPPLPGQGQADRRFVIPTHGGVCQRAGRRCGYLAGYRR